MLSIISFLHISVTQNDGHLLNTTGIPSAV
jgi:hypothetical protein